MRSLVVAAFLVGCGSGSLDLAVTEKSEKDDADEPADVVKESDEKPEPGAEKPDPQDVTPEQDAAPTVTVLLDKRGRHIGKVFSDAPGIVHIRANGETIQVAFTTDGFVAPESQPRCFIVTGDDCDASRCALASEADFAVLGGVLFIRQDGEKVSLNNSLNPLAASAFDGEFADTCEMGEPADFPEDVVEMALAERQHFTLPFQVRAVSGE